MVSLSGLILQSNLTTFADLEEEEKFDWKLKYSLDNLFTFGITFCFLLSYSYCNIFLYNLLTQQEANRT